MAPHAEKPVRSTRMLDRRIVEAGHAGYPGGSNQRLVPVRQLEHAAKSGAGHLNLGYEFELAPARRQAEERAKEDKKESADHLRYRPITKTRGSVNSLQPFQSYGNSASMRSISAGLM